MSEGDAGRERLRDAAAQAILDNAKRPEVGHVEDVVSALDAAKLRKYQDAYDLLLKGLLGEELVINTDTAITVLQALQVYYGDTNWRGEIEEILGVVEEHQHDEEIAPMRVKIRSIVERYNTRKSMRLEKIRARLDIALSYLKDNRAQDAERLLYSALSEYYDIKSKGGIPGREKELEDIYARVDEYKRRVESGEFGLGELLIQPFDSESGEPYDEDLDWLTAHQRGIWHGNSQILMIDPVGGRVLVQTRADKDNRRDLSATGHLFKGETYEAAAERIIQEETGLTSPRVDALQPLDIRGAKKIGRRDYDEDKPRYGTDKTKDDTFYWQSKEEDNREFDTFFIYVLTPEEVAEVEKPDNPLKEVSGNRFLSLSELLTLVYEDPAQCASTPLQLLRHRDNVTLVYRSLLDNIRHIFSDIIADPEKAQVTDLEYIESLRKTATTLITDWSNAQGVLKGKINSLPKPEAAGLINDFEAMHRDARTLTIWHNLGSFYEDGRTVLWDDLFNVVRLMGSFGREARTVEGRALLNVFLLDGVQLEKRARGGFSFRRGESVLKGVFIDDSGELRISNRDIKKGINTLRKGAIAADMDLTTAEHRKDIDQEMYGAIAQLRLLGMRYAVVSGNEFTLQYNRSLVQLIPPVLLDGYTIYASGAGVKVGFDQGGKEIPDIKYIKEISSSDREKVEEVLGGLRTAWRAVLRGMRKSVIDEEGNVNSNINEGDVLVSIEQALEGIETSLLVNGVDIIEEIKGRVAPVIEEVCTNPGKKLVGQLMLGDDDVANIDQLDLEKLRKTDEAWPFIDIRKVPGTQMVVQMTLKPICPSSGRELVADIVEKVLGSYPSIEVKRGGSTSIDCAPSGVSKAQAAEDLIKIEGLDPDNRHLLIAIDDEMDPTGVGFPFLTVPGITVISNEPLAQRRIYENEVLDQIQAQWFWTVDYDLGFTVEGTKKVFSLLIDTYVEEVFQLFEGMEVEPVTKKLRDQLESVRASSTGN